MRIKISYVTSPTLKCRIVTVWKIFEFSWKNYGHFLENPKHKIRLSTASSIFIRLVVCDRVRNPDASVSVSIFAKADGRLQRPVAKANKGVYTNAVCGVTTEPKILDAGVYVIVPSTFTPGVHANYELRIFSSSPVIRVA